MINYFICMIMIMIFMYASWHETAIKYIYYRKAYCDVEVYPEKSVVQQ